MIVLMTCIEIISKMVVPIGSLISSLLVVGIMFWGIKVAKKQLANVIASMRINSLNTIINLETQLINKSEELQQLYSEHRKTTSNKIKSTLLSDVDVKLSNYSNIAERLAYCVHYKFVDEETIKDEFWKFNFKRLWEIYLEKEEDADLKYKHLYRLCKKWLDEEK